MDNVCIVITESIEDTLQLKHHEGSLDQVKESSVIVVVVVY